MAELLFNDAVPDNAELTFGETQHAPGDLLFSSPASDSTELLFGASTGGNTLTVTASITTALPTPQAALNLNAALVASIGVVLPKPSAALTACTDDNILLPTTATADSSWQRAASTASETDAGWAARPYMAAIAHEQWQKAQQTETAAQGGWSHSLSQRAVCQGVWECGVPADATGAAGWQMPPRSDTTTLNHWQQGETRQQRTGSAFNYPPRNDGAELIPWGAQLALFAIHYTGSARYASPRLWSLLAPWEYGTLPAAGLSVLPPLPPIEPETPAPQGSPDLIFIQPLPVTAHLLFGAPNTPTFTHQRVYILMSDIQLIRQPDGAEIQCTRATFQTDSDSWGWKFSATLTDNDSLALLKPDANGPKSVSCTVNGYTFNAIVEGYGITREHGNNQYTVSGRSPSAWLADPYAPKSSALITSQLTARQICEAQLQNTGWTLDWQAVDWLVPASVFGWQQLDPIGVISRVASAIGAIVQTDRTQQILRVQSRYPVSPHNWAAATPDATLPLDLIRSLGSDYSRAPLFNRAIVAGTTGGVLVTSTRDGTAGDILAPQVVDALITHVDAGAERARMEIAKGGQRETIRATTWLTRNGDPGPGLLLPGSLLSVTDPNDPFTAQIDATQVNATRTPQSLTVTQTLNLERWLG